MQEGVQARHLHPTGWLIAIGILAGVAFVYYPAAVSYFRHDDVQWLAGAFRFRLSNLPHFEQYNGFYRPMIEAYYFVTWRMFGCAALPFHLASIAIHLVDTVLVFLIARAISGRPVEGMLAALFFAVHPSFTEAVAWVAAITDLLPAFWSLLAMWLWIAFLQRGRAMAYVVALAAFAGCLLTHESSAILLPMLVAADIMLTWRGDRIHGASWRARFLRYGPFIALLAGSLAINASVNSRSAIVIGGHYAFGWHAVPHLLQYIIGFTVTRQDLFTYVLAVVAMGAMWWRGSASMRFYLVWMVVTLGPVSFFTWGNASRYSYLPAAGFAMLLAELVIRGQTLAERWMTARSARVLATAVWVVLAVRFAMFAEKGTRDFRTLTRPYEQFVAATRAAHALSPDSFTIYLDAATADPIPEMYRNDASRVGSCADNLVVEVR